MSQIDAPRTAHCAGCGGWVTSGVFDEGHECYGLAEAAAPQPRDDLRAALEAAERVKAAAIENGGRLTPGAILDIQTVVLALRAQPSATPGTIECSDGDLLAGVEAMHEHIHISHPEADIADEVLRVPTPADSLDVERLAKALDSKFVYGTPGASAERVAAEYERLGRAEGSSKPPEPEP